MAFKSAIVNAKKEYEKKKKEEEELKNKLVYKTADSVVPIATRNKDADNVTFTGTLLGGISNFTGAGSFADKIITDFKNDPTLMAKAKEQGLDTSQLYTTQENLNMFGSDVKRVVESGGAGISRTLSDLGKGILIGARNMGALSSAVDKAVTDLRAGTENAQIEELKSKAKEKGIDTLTLDEYLDKAKNTKTSLELINDFSANTFDKWSNEANQRIVELQNETDNPFTKAVIGFVPNLSQQAVTIGASLINPVLGTSVATGQAMGSYYNDAKSRGMTDEQANDFSQIMGIVEGGTEMIGVDKLIKAGKGAKALTKGGLSSARRELSKEVITSTFGNLLGGSMDNFMQEAITEPIQEGVADWIGGKGNWENIDQRMLEAGINGAITSLITGGANIGVQSAVGTTSKIKNGQQLTQEQINQDLVDTLAEIEKFSPEEKQEFIDKYVTPGIKTAQDVVKNELNQVPTEPNRAVPMQTSENAQQQVQEQEQQVISNQDENALKENVEAQNQEQTQENQAQEENEFKTQEKKTISNKSGYNTPAKDGTIRLYTNTKAENINSILKDGLLIDKAKEKEYDGKMTWFETTPDLKGYGGTTIAVDVPKNLNMEKLNNTQYGVYDNISPDNIVFIDKPAFNNYRTSDIQELVDKFGKDKVLEVFDKSNNKSITREELENIINSSTQENLTSENKNENVQEKVTSENENAQENENALNQNVEPQNLVESAERSGIDVKDEKTRKNLETIQKFNENRGVKATFDADAFKGHDNVNSFFRTDENGNREIVFNPNTKTDKTIEQLAVHEVYHDMVAGGTAQELTDFVVQKMSNNPEYQEYVRALQDVYEEQDSDIIKEEAVAHYLEKNLGTDEFISELQQRGDRTTIQRIIDTIKDMITKAKNTLTGKGDLNYLLDLQRKYEQAYNGEFKGSQEQTKLSKQVDGNETEPIKVQYKGEEREYKNYYDYMKDISENEEQLANNLLFKHNSYDFEIPTSKNETSFYHGTDYSGYYKDLNLQDYGYGMDRNYGDYFYVTSDKTQTTPYGKQIAQFIIPNDKILSLEEYRKMGNVSDEELFNKYLAIEMPDNEYIIKDIDKVKEYTLDKAKEYIKNKDQQTQPTTDNQGRTLTKEQQDYFKDSKVRDEDGKLIELYHTTPEFGFTIFDREKLSRTPRTSKFGKGFYFTDDEIFSRQYLFDENGNMDNSGTYKTYLNLTKPLIIEDTVSQTHTLDRNKIKELLIKGDNVSFFNKDIPSMIINETIGDENKLRTELSKLNKEEMVEKYLQEHFDKPYAGDRTILSEMVQAYKTNTELIDNFSKIFNVDGIIVKGGRANQYIAFNSNQIKNVDNTNPTENADIRFSKEAPTKDNQGRELSNGQQEYFKNSKVRDKDGNLIEVYHGTPTGGFTIYDTSKLGKTTKAKDSKLGIHFTDNVDLANLFKQFTSNEIKAKAREEINNKYNIEYGIVPPNMVAKLNKEVNDLADKMVKESGEVKSQYIDIKKPLSIYADYGISEQQLADDLAYIATGKRDVSDVSEYFESNMDMLSAIQQNAENELAEFKDELAKPEAIERAKELGYDGAIFPLQKTDILELANSNLDTNGNEYIVFNSEQAKNTDNLNPTTDKDIRYQQQGTGTSQDIINNFLENTKVNEGTGTAIKDLARVQEETTEPVRQVAPSEAPVQVPQQDIPKERVVEPIKDITDVERPQVPQNQKTRKTYESIINSNQMTQEAKQIAKELMGYDTYVPQTNEFTLAVADRNIKQNGVDESLTSLTTKINNNERVNAVDIATGERLIEYYSKIGDREKLQEAIQTTAMAGTEAGRAVQAMSMINHQTPIGQVTWIQRSVDKVNKRLAKEGKKAQFNFTPEMQQKILNSTSENLQQNLTEVYKELGKQVPKSNMEKFNEWRYFSMLANPKTHFRNILGNLVMAQVQRAKNKVAGTIEDFVIGDNAERWNSLKGASKGMYEFAKNDLKNADVQSMLGLNENKYNPQSRLQQNQRTFKSDLLENTLGKLFNLNSKALEVEDGWGLKSGYAKAMANYLNANNLDYNNLTDAQLQKARNYAVQQAKEATFHQENIVANVLQTWENKNLFTKVALGGAIPFKKTPMNVALTGFEYSPAGFAKTLTTDLVNLRKGKISANQFIDNISKNLTGTAISLLGYGLTQAGILKASGSGDEDKDEFEEATGKQNYSIQIGDNTYSLDWLTPAGIPLFIGSELYQVSHQKEDGNKPKNENEAFKSITKILDATASAMNPMSEMTMISGLTNALKSYAQGSTKSIENMIANVGKSYVTQTVPTALGQIARSTDQYERSTTSTETDPMAKAIDSAKNQIISKIPGLRETLPISTDVWGNERETQDYVSNAILPWTSKEISKDPVNKALTDLYDATGESGVLPDNYIDKSLTIDKEKYKLTNEEYARLKQQYGKTAHDILSDLTKSKEYEQMSDEQKVKAVKEAYSYAKSTLKVTYSDENNLDAEESSTYKKVQSVIDNGGDAKEYFEYVGLIDGLDKDKDKIQALKNSNIKDKGAIYESTVGKNDATYQIMKNTRVNDKAYLDYKLQDFTGDKDANGKTTYSKQDKFYDYMDNANMTYEQKLLLTGMNYKLLPGERDTLANYIDTLPISASEKTDIYKKLKGATVYQNGEIYY